MTKYITTKAGLTLVESTTERQKKNGTRIFTLLTNKGVEIFGTYKSGYVRRITGRSPYQLNQRRVITNNAFRDIPVTNSEGDTISSVRRRYTYDTHVRALIPNSKNRLNYLLEFVDRNYSMQVCRK